MHLGCGKSDTGLGSSAILSPVNDSDDAQSVKESPSDFFHTNLKTSDMTRKSIFAHRPKRFVMEDRPDFGVRKPRGEVLG